MIKPTGKNDDKNIRCCISSNSGHLKFWRDAEGKVSSWRFIKPATKSQFRPPTQNGWLTTIAAMRQVWETVQEAGYNNLETRNLNQDPLENLFGVIRLNCGSNRNPTIEQFVDALKCSIVNSFAFKNLIDSNCEEDGANMLDNLHSLIPDDESAVLPTSSHDNATVVTSEYLDQITRQVQSTDVTGVVSDLASYAEANFSSSIAKQLLKHNTCAECKETLTTEQCSESTFPLFVTAETSMNEPQVYPSTRLIELVHTGLGIAQNTLKVCPEMERISAKIISAMRSGIGSESRTVGCSAHHKDIKDGIILGVARYYITFWCKQKNQELRDDRRGRSRERK